MTALRARLSAPFENPVLRRELRLVARRGRFEWLVLLLTVGMTLVIASVGGRGGAGRNPAEVGKEIFQTYFSLAQSLILLAGPAVAASSIALEREGRTYEALMLTGIAPGRIASGKFFAAVTNVVAYVVALAPVGALPFLFGGISAVSVLVAFAMLFVFAALAALLGLAISARLPTTRSALTTSVIAGAGAAYVMFKLFGESLGDKVCRALGVARPGTTWLPAVLLEGTQPAWQSALLVAVPLSLALLVGWFLFEVCSANLSDPSSDRATGLKRWYVVSALFALACGTVLISAAGTRSDRADAAIESIGNFGLFALLGAFVFQGDVLVAPRRVRMQWRARKAGVLRRFFGPGITASAALQLGATALVVGVLSAVGIVMALGDEDLGPSGAPLGIIAMALPVTMFLLFVVGLGTFLRVRNGATVGRAVLGIVVLVLFVAPYAITTILGANAATADSMVPLLAAPSPAFALDVAKRIAADQSNLPEVAAALTCTGFYALAGVILLAAGTVRADRLVASLDADAARMDTLIAREDGKLPAEPKPSTARRAAPQPARGRPAAQQPARAPQSRPGGGGGGGGGGSASDKPATTSTSEKPSLPASFYKANRKSDEPSASQPDALASKPTPRPAHAPAKEQPASRRVGGVEEVDFFKGAASLDADGKPVRPEATAQEPVKEPVVASSTLVERLARDSAPPPPPVAPAVNATTEPEPETKSEGPATPPFGTPVPKQPADGATTTTTTTTEGATAKSEDPRATEPKPDGDKG